MAKTQTYIIENNWGGITDDARSDTRVSFDVLRNFDLNKSTAVLAPHRDLEADDSGTKKITSFVYANNTFYGLGVDTSAGTKLEFYDKSPFDSGTWDTVTGGQSSAVSSLIGYPAHYKDYIYGVHQTNKVFQYGDITGTPSFTDAHGTLSSSPSFAAEPFIHPSDDILYIPYDNKLASIDVTTFTATVLTLPDNLTIRSLDAWGEYLAIGCSGNGISVDSKMFLWNRIDADITNTVNYGKEVLFQIANIGGKIMSVSLSTSSNVRFSQYMVCKEWNGGEEAQTFFSKDLGAQGYSILKPKIVEENSMYFCLDINSNSEPHNQGIWSIGRKNVNYPFRVNHEITSVNDTIESNTQGFYKLGDYFWIAHSTDGSIERTNDTASYTTTSIAETEKITGDDITKKKEAIKVGVIYKNFAGGEQIVLKYKADGESSYTTILTASTSGTTAAFAENTSAGANLPTEWNELQLRAESTGGAEILAIIIEFEEMERN